MLDIHDPDTPAEAPKALRRKLLFLGVLLLCSALMYAELALRYAH